MEKLSAKFKREKTSQLNYMQKSNMNRNDFFSPQKFAESSIEQFK